MPTTSSTKWADLADIYILSSSYAIIIDAVVWLELT